MLKMGVFKGKLKKGIGVGRKHKGTHSGSLELAVPKKAAAVPRKKKAPAKNRANARERGDEGSKHADDKTPAQQGKAGGPSEEAGGGAAKSAEAKAFEANLSERVRKALAEAELETLTVKKLRKQLQAEMGVDLHPHKELVRTLVDKFLAEDGE